MRYDAFISYRHAEADMFLAQKLHKSLETFPFGCRSNAIATTLAAEFWRSSVWSDYPICDQSEQSMGTPDTFAYRNNR